MSSCIPRVSLNGAGAGAGSRVCRRQPGLPGALGDATRLRLCALLSVFELSVIELTTVMELGQSKVSTHLARLKEQGLVLDRKVGTSSYYRLNESGMSAPARRVWEALLSTLDDATVG